MFISPRAYRQFVTLLQVLRKDTGHANSACVLRYYQKQQNRMRAIFRSPCMATAWLPHAESRKVNRTVVIRINKPDKLNEMNCVRLIPAL